MGHLNSFKRRIKGILLITFIVQQTNQVSAQQDFNHFQTLVSQGPIPEDFTRKTLEKIEQEKGTRENLKSTDEKVFLEGIHFHIDQILHSGSVIYGDEISQYVTKIADRLLKDEPELRSKLRFYTIKSNETNALSTDQGIVFVTTGLISQLSSEAQLAFVLAHEIVHYKEKHVAESFEFTKQNKYVGDRIQKMSRYSKDHEFEADRLALEWYHKAGYAPEEIFAAFDVLMYSYLPFDEVEVPVSYFSTPQFYIPANYFPDKKYEIKAEEDYEDFNSSHPNIKKRKEAIEEMMGANGGSKQHKTYENWGTKAYLMEESEFLYIRNLARFESLRTDIIQANFARALYDVFLLEKDFPQSVYLRHMKAYAWLGIVQFRINGNESEYVLPTNQLEGESAAVDFLLKKLNDKATYSLGIRSIYEIRKLDPQDEILNGITERLWETLAKDEDLEFSFSQYSTKTFAVAAEEAIAKKADTLVKQEEPKQEEPKGSKYERIKTKRNLTAPESFDSTKFYLYGLADIVTDSAFIESFETVKKRVENEKENEIDLSEMTRKERDAYEKELKKSGVSPLAMGLDKFILVQPEVNCYKKGKVNLEQSALREKQLYEQLDIVADKLNIEHESVDQNSLQLNGTTAYNERNALYSMLEQAAYYEDTEPFPVDFMALKQISSDYGTNNLLFTLLEHEYDPDINLAAVGIGCFFVVTIPIVVCIYLPIKFAQGHQSEITLLVIDAKSGAVKKASFSHFNNQLTPYYMGAHYYDLLEQLKQQPK